MTLFDEMPGLALVRIPMCPWWRWVEFQGVCLGRYDGEHFIPNDLFDTVPEPEQVRIVQIVGRYTTTQQIRRRLTS